MSREPTEQEIQHRTELLLARRRAWEQHTNMGQFVSTLELERYTPEVARLEAIEQLTAELVVERDGLKPREARRRQTRRTRYDAAVAAIVSELGNPTDEEVAHKLGVDDGTIQRWRARGDIP